MQYKSVLISQRGGPEALRVVSDTLREPVKNEIRIKERRRLYGYA